MNRAGLFSSVLSRINIKFRATAYLILLCNPVVSQRNLPEFEGRDLNGSEIKFSEVLVGKKSLVGFAFTPRVQEGLQTWIQPVYDEFIDTNTLSSLVYDIKVYLVICFNNVNIAAKNKVIRELKENVLEECFGNVILTDTESKNIREWLRIEDEDTPHLYALDEDGVISYHTTGNFSDTKFEKLASYLEIE